MVASEEAVRAPPRSGKRPAQRKATREASAQNHNHCCPLHRADCSFLNICRTFCQPGAKKNPDRKKNYALCRARPYAHHVTCFLPCFLNFLSGLLVELCPQVVRHTIFFLVFRLCLSVAICFANGAVSTISSLRRHGSLVEAR